MNQKNSYHNGSRGALTDAYHTLDQLVRTSSAPSRFRRFVSRPFLIAYFALAALALPQKCEMQKEEIFIPTTALVGYPLTLDAITEEKSREFSTQSRLLNREISSDISDKLAHASEKYNLLPHILPTLYLLSKRENNPYHHEKSRNGYGGIILLSEAQVGILQSTLDQKLNLTIDYAAQRVKEISTYLDRVPEREKMSLLIALYFTDKETTNNALQRARVCVDRLDSAFISNPFLNSQIRNGQKPIPKMTLSSGRNLYEPNDGDKIFSSLDEKTLSTLYDEATAQWKITDKMPKNVIAGPFVPYHYNRDNCMKFGHAEYDYVILSAAERGFDTTKGLEIDEEADTYCFASITKYILVKGENNLASVVRKKIAQANRYTKEDFLAQVKEDRDCLWYGSHLDQFTQYALVQYIVANTNN